MAVVGDPEEFGARMEPREEVGPWRSWSGAPVNRKFGAAESGGLVPSTEPEQRLGAIVFLKQREREKVVTVGMNETVSLLCLLASGNLRPRRETDAAG